MDLTPYNVTFPPKTSFFTTLKILNVFTTRGQKRGGLAVMYTFIDRHLTLTNLFLLDSQDWVDLARWSLVFMRWALGPPGTGQWSCPSTAVNERAKTQFQT